MAALRKAIAEEEGQYRADEMTGQARINELEAQRAALQDQINDGTEAGLEAKKRDLALGHEINAAYKQQADEIDRLAKKHEETVEKRYLASATPEEKKRYLQGKQDRLRKEAADIDAAGGYQAKLEKAGGLEKQAVLHESIGEHSAAGSLRKDAEKLRMEAAADQYKFDPAKAAKKREEADDLQDGIDEAAKGGQRVKVAVGDSLQRVGGGGGHTSGLDQGVRQRDKTNQLLQQLVELQKTGTVTVRDPY